MGQAPKDQNWETALDPDLLPLPSGPAGPPQGKESSGYLVEVSGGAAFQSISTGRVPIRWKGQEPGSPRVSPGEPGHETWGLGAGKLLLETRESSQGPHGAGLPAPRCLDLRWPGRAHLDTKGSCGHDWPPGASFWKLLPGVALSSKKPSRRLPGDLLPSPSSESEGIAISPTFAAG